MIIPNVPTLIIIMICFWVTFVIIDKFLLKPIGKVLEERKQRIDGAQKEWESKHEDYLSTTKRIESEIEEAAREAANIRSGHRDAAQAKRQEKLEKARAEAADQLDGALQELEADAAKAREELRQQAQELARILAGHLLEREVAS
jgi:F-type H+-transporting ATPase subunit b